MMLCDSCFHANTCMNFCVGEGAYVMSGCQYYDNADRLRELAEADRDGRCVVLPCKVGDKVFVRADTWGNTWNFVTVDCGKFLVGEIIGFVKTRKQTLMKIQVEHNVSWKKERKRYPVSALGLTVFLTRESALKAGDTP